MTVEELRRYLADKPGDAEVVIPTSEGGFRKATSLVRCKAETFVSRRGTRMVEFFDQANRRAYNSDITEVFLVT